MIRKVKHRGFGMDWLRYRLITSTEQGVLNDLVNENIAAGFTVYGAAFAIIDPVLNKVVWCQTLINVDGRLIQ